MDFITGSLPNVMFIAGLLAMGIGLGMEFKIVEIKSELSKQGRLGAIGLGAVLVSISIYLYTRPPQLASSPGTVAGAQPAVVQASAGGGASAPQPALVTVVVTTTPPASATAASPTPTLLPPTATAVAPTATALPPTARAVPPTATPLPPTATAMPAVQVPDIQGKSIKDAEKVLIAAGLRLGEQHERCEDIRAQAADRKLKRGQIRCQSPAAGSLAAPNAAVLVVLEGDEKEHDD
jgi:hypothetical protein